MLLKKSIKLTSTIISCYIAHVKHQCVKSGCCPEYLASDVFGYHTSGSQFLDSGALKYRLNFSFFDVLWFHVLQKLSLKSLVLVGARGKQQEMNNLSSQNQEHLLFTSTIIGFYFDISDKFHPVARAYYPKLSDTNPTWSRVCPLRPLKWLLVYGLLQSSPCQKDRLTEKLLIQTMQTIDKNVRDFKIYSIRIGAHTFFMR